jgi:hypothetical protein
MKSPRVHAILGDVYRLLGNYTAAEFAEAGKYGNIARPVRDALRALSRKASTDATSGSAERRESHAISAASRPRLSGDASSVRDVATAIRQTPRFTSTQVILQFAKETGLSVSPRPKESRERLARRVAEAIFLAREPRRSQIISRLAGEGDSQTQGWIDVIKNPRP